MKLFITLTIAYFFFFLLTRSDHPEFVLLLTLKGPLQRFNIHLDNIAELIDVPKIKLVFSSNMKIAILNSWLQKFIQLTAIKG